jgi:hypothetical protein
MQYWLNVDAPNHTQVLHVDGACGDVQRKGSFGVKKAGELNRVGGWLPFESITDAETNAASRLAKFQPIAYCSNCRKTTPTFHPTIPGLVTPSNDAGSLPKILASLRPTAYGAVYELVQAAGLNISEWYLDQDGNDIKPSENMFRNSQWSFGGGDQPIILCVWWRDLEVRDDQIEYHNNSKEFHTKLGNDLAAPWRTASEAQRLRGKIRKSRDFEVRVSEAFRKRKPVRFILLEGDAATWDEAATVSSHTEARRLDPSPWFVHQYDPFGGEQLLVRGIQPPARRDDPFGGAADPGDDPAFTAFLEDAPLTDTEKDALVKLRVGQGYFREQLIKRWGGCSVTGCADESVLIASHIVPWSKCVSRVERLSVANGLLLTPNLDKLFDKGLISFDQRGKIMISPRLSLATATALHVDPGLQLKKRGFEDIQPFLERHRNEIFKAPAKN